VPSSLFGPSWVSFSLVSYSRTSERFPLGQPVAPTSYLQSSLFLSPFTISWPGFGHAFVGTSPIWSKSNSATASECSMPLLWHFNPQSHCIWFTSVVPCYKPQRETQPHLFPPTFGRKSLIGSSSQSSSLSPSLLY